jgi:DNA invertase Pin-like site-specific DNA recombinase
MNTNLPLLPYYRQSVAKNDSISEAEQARDCARWAKAAGVPLLDPVVEIGVSGNKPWRQRALGEAIARCQAGEAGGIIVSWLDRLSREKGSAYAEVLETLRDSGLRLVVANEGVDTASGAQSMFLTIKGAIAREQWERHQANWKSAKHSAFERGIHGAGAPAGYDVGPGRKLVKNEHADVIKRAFTLRAGGAPWGSIAALFTDAGVPSMFGSTTWGIPAATKVLTNPIYKGVTRCFCGCGEEVRNSELAIIGPKIWDEVQPVKNGKTGRGPGSGSHLLNGIIRCASCGALMQAGSTAADGRRYRFYRCPNVGKGRCQARAAVSAPAIEEHIVQIALARTEGRIEEETVDLAPLESAVEAAADELKAYQLAVPASTPGFAEAVGQRAAVLAAAQDALEDGRQRGGVTYMTPEEMRRVFDSGTIEAQRAALRELLPGGATVKRGRMPIEEKVAA